MGPAHNLKPMAEWPLILVEGGDDRQALDPNTRTNQYFVGPEPVNCHFRGSCTCNMPTFAAYDAAKLVYDQM